MQLSSSISVFHLTWLIFFIKLFSFSISDPRTSEAGLFCGQGRNPNASFISVFTSEMEIVSQRVLADEGSQFAVSGPNTSIYALFQCYQDLPRTDCQLCYAISRTRLPRCLPATSGSIYFDGCFLRYDSYNFYNESVDPIRDSTNCSSSTGVASPIEEPIFRRNVGELIDNLTLAALSNGGYAVMGWNGVFGLAQCWNSLSGERCRECLAKASRQVRGCAPSREGRGLYAGCYMRYSTQQFYSDGSQNLNNGSRASRTGTRVAIASAVACFCMLSLFAAFACYRRIKKSKQARKNLGPILSSYNRSNLNFKYETLEKATDYFHSSNKIGQGGAGCVYKGTLPDGKTVAVKRLFFNTRQWVDEFFNEVNLISGIQHKNLVKLMGCSIEGPESLLVYEFVPNGSLDQYLFDKKRIKILSWKERLAIIVGTAEGIAFLHGGAETRIIHRDIKGSNVLLDENLSPKIADFGLARCFAADKTHLSTGIAGTLGYMAPEYLVRGQLTEKADVYSFGVLVLEIVSGRKNNAFAEDSGSLLQTVWKLYKMEKLAQTVDPGLEGDFPTKEAYKVLQIGLLCTQASAASRPSMDNVVQMLTDEDYEIPQPNQPPFVNNSFLSASTSKSCSINSLVLNALSKLEISNTSTGSSSMQSLDNPPRTA